MLASLNCQGEVHLFVGVSPLAYTRAQTVLANGATPIVITHTTEQEKIPRGLVRLEDEKKVKILRRKFDVERDLVTLGREKCGQIVDRVYVNLSATEEYLKEKIFDKCQVYRIPVNTTERAELSTFTLLSTYQDGDFQLGITTSGKGCKLASRIKREIVSQLPKNIGQVCETVGALRMRIQEEDRIQMAEQFKAEYEKILDADMGEHEDDAVQTSRFNTFVSEFNMTETQKRLQRSRWLSQVVEYYPFSKLATLSVDDLSQAYTASTSTKPNEESTSSTSNVSKSLPTNTDESSPSTTNTNDTTTIASTSNTKGTISLVGSGPGSVSSLTIGALHEINTADIVLADKLVPQQVIDLIPSKTEKFIARKFPGNAEAAQNELLDLGLKSLQEGKKVVRLKQGDPYIFGRGGEEYLFFKEHGFEPNVLPGISSALSSTVNSLIPATQRDVADQVLICTGTGRRGVLPNLPEFVETRTTVFLMSLHRIQDLVPALVAKGWDPKCPAAIVERSSCPDQRITRTKLEYLVEAVEEIGSRPPGLLVVGRACEALTGPIEEKWRVEEGYDGGDQGVVSFLKGIQS